MWVPYVANMAPPVGTPMFNSWPRSFGSNWNSFKTMEPQLSNKSSIWRWFILSSNIYIQKDAILFHVFAIGIEPWTILKNDTIL